MANSEDSSDFNATRAELFEAISHPVRIKILQALNEKPMGFSELGRVVGIESGGHLGFHLKKLTHLVKTTSEGTYALTGDGKEALWSINALRKSSNGTAKTTEASVKHRNLAKPALGALLIALVVFGAVAVYQQEQIIAQQGENQLLRSNLTAVNSQISNLQKQIATLKDANWKLPTCTATPFSLSGVLYPADQASVRALIIPLLQNLSEMAVTANITSYTTPTLSPSSYLSSSAFTFAYRVVSESTSGANTTYKVNFTSVFYNGAGNITKGSIQYQSYGINETAWVKSDGAVSAVYVTYPPNSITNSSSYTNSTATSYLALAMLPFLRHEYCQSLAAEIQFYTSAQFLNNGTSIQNLGPTTMQVTGYKASILPLNATSIPTIWDYGLKMSLQSISSISMQVGPVPTTGVTLVTFFHLDAVCPPSSCGPYLVYPEFTLRVTSATGAGEA